MYRPLSGWKRLYPIIIYGNDVIAFSVAYLGVHWWMYGSPGTHMTVRIGVIGLMILFIRYHAYGLYRSKRSLFDEVELRRMAKAHLVVAIVLMAMLWAFGYLGVPEVIVLFLQILVAYCLGVMGRFGLSTVVHLFRKKGYDLRRVIVFGENPDIIRHLSDDRSLGYRLVATTHILDQLVSKIDTTDIVFVAKEKVTDQLMQVILMHDRVEWKLIPSALNLVVDAVDFDEFKDYPVITVRQSTATIYARYGKRAFDLVCSGLGLIILSPVFGIIALCIKLTMPGPVFFRQQRLGVDLKPFMLIKFRSMVIDAERKKKTLRNEVQGLFKLTDDPRITPLGKWLRRTALDELPQLINVFKGEMSLVGPRPHLESELIYFKGWRSQRFSVRPGMTGLWQVNGRHALNLDKAVLFDIYYIRRISLWGDIKILLRTIPALLVTRGRY